jgi:hypothetical protein
MTRKDSEKESERPHYYSQFWLDVAAGRRVIGAPKPNEEGDGNEVELPEITPPRRGRLVETDMRHENIVHPVAEPIAAPEEFIEPDTDDFDLGVATQDEPSYEAAPLADADIPDMDLGPADEDEEEEFYEDEDEEEDEEDVNWSRGRKKNKPTRPVKPPVKKPGKRDSRRGY